MNKTQIIETLGLEPHPLEGGYFKRTYESDINLPPQDNITRQLLTTIYYMLSDDSPICFMHKNQSDIVHFHQHGAAMKYWIITPQGQVSEHILGPDIANGHQLQLVVKGGDWKTSQLLSGDYGLLAEAVAPGFEYSDNECASFDQFKQLFPELADRFKDYIKPATVDL